MSIDQIDEDKLFADGQDDLDQEELFEHYKVVVDKGQELLRVDKFLQNRLF